MFFFLYPIYLGFKFDSLNKKTFLGPFYLLHLIVGIANHIKQCEDEMINELDIYYCHLIFFVHLYILFYHKIYHYNYLVISIIFMFICKYIYDKILKKYDCVVNYDDNGLAWHALGLHYTGALANTFFILALLK
jgi:hypothetical protein